MWTKPATLRYRGWVIESLPARAMGGWCAIVVVLGRNRTVEAVAFTPIFGDCYNAWLGGLMAGRRWIDAGLLSPHP